MLPRNMAQDCQQFATLYDTFHTGRKLQWVWKSALCELAINAFSQRYTAKCSLLQALLLLLFNDHESITEQEFREQLLIRNQVGSYMFGMFKFFLKMLFSADIAWRELGRTASLRSAPEN